MAPVTSVAVLLQAASEGEAPAWQELVSRFGGVIAEVGSRQGLSAADMATLQQATWVRLVENVDRIQQPEGLGAWLDGMALSESVKLAGPAGAYLYDAGA